MYSAIVVTLSVLMCLSCTGAGLEETEVSTGVEHISSDSAGEVQERVSGPRMGGVFKFPGYFALIADPVYVEYFDSLLVSELYSGLTTITDDTNAYVQPDLADRWPVNDDGLVYQFVLRQDLKFSDGSPVSAEDFKWSWERALDPFAESHHAQDVFGDVYGSSSVMDGSANEITGVEVVDDRTLQVTLVRPRADFPALLADPVAVVLKPENVDKWGYDVSGWWSDPQVLPLKMNELPVGTGPFKLTEFDASNRAVIARNEYYHKNLAYLDGVEFAMRLEGDYYKSNADGFERDEFDIMFFHLEDANRYDVSDEIENGRSVYVDAPDETRFFAFNASVEPYEDEHFRRALIEASDVEGFIKDRVNADVAHSLLPPDMPSHDPTLKVFGRDPERAVAELSDSRYANNADELSLEYVETTWGWSKREIEELSKQWRDILGVRLRYLAVYPEEFVKISDSNDIEMLFFRIVPNYPDPHAVLRVFGSAFKAVADSPEHATARHMLGMASSELDPALRVQAYSELERFLLEEALALPFEWLRGGYFVVVKPWVRDLVIPKYSGSMFQNVWLDETAPERTLP